MDMESRLRLQTSALAWSFLPAGNSCHFSEAPFALYVYVLVIQSHLTSFATPQIPLSIATFATAGLFCPWNPPGVGFISFPGIFLAQDQTLVSLHCQILLTAWSREALFFSLSCFFLWGGGSGRWHITSAE